MDPITERSRQVTRRTLLRGGANGLGAMALGSLLGKKLGFAFGPRQRGRGLLGPEQSNRMRIKSEHNGRPSTLRGLRLERLNDGSVPEMHSIEVPDRERTATKMVRECIDLTKNFHVDRFGRGEVDRGWSPLSMRSSCGASVSNGLSVFQRNTCR